jgi:hypothetical protein
MKRQFYPLTGTSAVCVLFIFKVEYKLQTSENSGLEIT